MANYTGLVGAYPVANPIATGLATAREVIGLRNDIQQSRDAAEDRDATRRYRGLQLDQAQLGVDKARREADQERTLSGLRQEYFNGLPSPQSAPVPAGGGLALQRAPQQNAAQPSGGAETDTPDELARQYHSGVNRLQASDKHFDSLADFADALQTGNGAAMEKAWPGVLASYNAIHAQDIRRGVGDQLPNGETIVDKKVTNFLGTKDGRFVPELTVTAADANGQRREYSAPVTVGRSADPQAQVMTKSGDDLLGDLHSALEAGLLMRQPRQTGLSGAQSPTPREQWDAMYRQKFLAAGVPPDKVDAYMGRAQPVGSLQTVADESGKPILVQGLSDGTYRTIDGRAITNFRPYDAKALPPDLQQRLNVATVAEAERKAKGLPTGGSGGNSYFVPVQTPQGYFGFNSRTGTAAPLTGADGKQLVPAAIDPTTQGNVASAKAQGTARGKFSASQPKVLASLNAADAKTATVTGAIDKALGMVDKYTTGMAGSTLAHVPGTDAKDLQRTLDSIRANIGFNELQEMRANSPTGGALGAVSDQENALLQSVLGSLSQDQSPAQLKENLTKAKAAIMASRDRLRSAYQQDFGSGGVQSPAGDGSQASGVSNSPRRQVRTGTLPDGRRVTQYDDGSTEVQ